MSARRRATILAVAAACAASLASLAGPARADSCGPPLLSSCINDDNFWPHAGPSQFLAIGSTETVPRGQVGFGVVTSYLSQPIKLHVSSPGPGGSDAFAINDQVNGTFLWAYGVTNRLEIDAALPITFIQSGAGTSPVTGASPQVALQDTALRDLRFGLAYALVPRARIDPHVPTPGSGLAGHAFAVTARFEMSAPTGDQSQFGGDRTAVWVPSVAADYRRDRLFAGVEVGARLRPVAELAGARVGSQLVTALGAGYDVLPRELLSVVLEARALPTFSQQNSTQQTPEGLVSAPNGQIISPAEWALSVRTAPIAGGDFTLQLGGGGPIPLSSDAAITNPRFRFSLSVRYAPLARDTDGDGILDKDDKCPQEPGVKGGKGGDGCPPSQEHDTLDLSGPAKPADAPVSPSPTEPRPDAPSMPRTPDATPAAPPDATPDVTPDVKAQPRR
jgi:OOP family OmpA-OmpF porin